MAIKVDKLQIQINVRLPRIPNFLLTNSGDKFHVSEFSKKELLKIGTRWVDELVAKGKD